MRSSLRFVLVTAAVAAVTLAACGDSDDGGGNATTTSRLSTSTSTTSTTIYALEQAAIWPSASVYFSTPEAAAKDFVENALKVPAALGEFRPGDSRSGEIQVFSPGEGGSATRVERGLLLLRQLGSRNGWFVLAGTNENANISSLGQGANVPSGPLAVSGKARGFEGNVVVSARIAGNADTLSSVITQGGSFETPKAYKVTLDLSAASSGDTVMLLVRGGTGLETDPGEFGAIAVVVE